MVATKPRRPRYADAADELLSMDEVHDRFDGESILLKIAVKNERAQVTHGYVLAHTHSEKLITKVCLRTQREDPDARFYTFVAGTRVLSREEWMRRIAELADGPFINAHW